MGLGTPATESVEVCVATLPLVSAGEALAMSYIARVVKVLIASPGDVDKERKAIRSIVYDWNVQHSEREKLVLLPIMWETHSSPTMGDRPQAIINETVAIDCDLLIAVFWTRLGTNTGVAASGTVEEIERHLADKRPAMLYFSSARVDPESVDPEQYSALKAFKASCRAQGLLEGYKSLSEFRTKLSRQLALEVARRFVGVEADEAPKRPEPRETEVSVSKLACQLLLIAASDEEDGQICTLDCSEGLVVSIARRPLLRSSSGRLRATWEKALSELEVLGLITRRGFGGFYDVTAAGYDHHERVKAKLTEAIGPPPSDHAMRILSATAAIGDAFFVVEESPDGTRLRIGGKSIEPIRDSAGNDLNRTALDELLSRGLIYHIERTAAKHSINIDGYTMVDCHGVSARRG